MKRREFIAGLGGAAAWLHAAHAQRTDRARRVGVLITDEDSPGIQSAIATIRDGLTKLGWVEGRNLQIDLRFGGGNAGRIRAYAAELVSLNPDVIVTSAAAATRALQQLTPTIPIVITAVGDPQANGFVKKLARPDGNITGVTNLFASFGGKWIQFLKEAAPRLERLGLIYPPELLTDIAADSLILPVEEEAHVLGVQAIKIPYHDAIDLVHGIEAFAAEPNGGLIILPAPTATDVRTMLRLATEKRLPTISLGRNTVVAGGLMSYGVNPGDLYRRVPYFVDRILRGAKPVELPVEFPTKFEFVINLKTAKALGLDIPPSLLAIADEVIE